MEVINDVTPSVNPSDIEKLEQLVKYNYKEYKDVKKVIIELFDLLSKTHFADLNLLHTVSATAFANVILHVITRANVNKELVTILQMCSGCILLPSDYVRELFRTDNLWDYLLSLLLKVEGGDSSQIYYEIVWFFVTIFIFVERKNVYRCDRVVVVDESEYFYWISKTCDPTLFTRVIQKLLFFQKTKFVQKKTQKHYPNILYKHLYGCVLNIGYPDDQVIQPVHIICALAKCFICQPQVSEVFIGNAKFMEVFMDALQYKSEFEFAKILLSYLLAAIEDSYQKFSNIFELFMKNVDFPIMLQLSLFQNHIDVRKNAQETITTILVFRDKKEIAPAIFPSRSRLTEISYEDLINLIQSKAFSDQKFAFFILAEQSCKDNVRNIIIKKGFPQYALKILEENRDAGESEDLQLIDSTLMLIQRLTKSNVNRQKKLQLLDGPKVIKNFMYHQNHHTKYTARATLVNLIGRDVKVQMSFFGSLNINTLIKDAQDIYKKFQNKELSKPEFFNNQHLNLAFLKQWLTVYNLIIDENPVIDMPKITKARIKQLMNIFNHCFENKTSFPPSFPVLCIGCLCYLIQYHEYVDVSEYLSDDMLEIILSLYNDPTTKPILDHEIHFEKVFLNRYPNWKLPEKHIQEEISNKKDLRHKCANPPCLNYGSIKKNSGTLTSGLSLKRCGNCKKAFYCGKSCQQAHWKVHKKECIKVAKQGQFK